jgi:hypothetical protein
MIYAFHVSDETYRAIEAIASGQGQTPEALVEAWLKERVEAESAIARQNADWDAHLEETLAQVGQGQTPVYHSTEEFFAALDAVPVESTKEKSDH